MSDVYDRIQSCLKDKVKKTEERINKFHKMLENVPVDSDRYESLLRSINDCKQFIISTNGKLEFIRRPVDSSDIEYRHYVMENFPDRVKEIFPGDVPIVFYGTDNIATVRQILQTGGLFAPEQCNINMKSFASKIDVTYKSNVKFSCQYAEPKQEVMPYGAIFAFRPQDDELKKVFKTGDSLEVSGGVRGVNFIKEPNRLYGIITTPENIERVKAWCKESSIDPNKVYTHDAFIEKYKKEKITYEVRG